MPYYEVTISRTIKVYAGSPERASRIAANELEAIAKSREGLEITTNIKDADGNEWTGGGTIKMRW